MFPFEKTAVGDFAVSWKLAETISVETSRRVLCCYQALRESKNPVLKQITDIVPTYLSVTVYFREAGNDEIQKAVALTDEFFSRLDMNSADNGKGSVLTVEFPVVYNGADLERVAEIHGISVESVIRLHCSSEYRVAMIGFKPYFPYLIGLPAELETPRLDSPRLSVPAGSVAVGGAQTGIYPEVSPGGWNLLGVTDPELLKQLCPGDRVLFKAVSK